MIGSWEWSTPLEHDVRGSSHKVFAGKYEEPECLCILWERI